MPVVTDVVKILEIVKKDLKIWEECTIIETDQGEAQITFIAK